MYISYNPIRVEEYLQSTVSLAWIHQRALSFLPICHSYRAMRSRERLIYLGKIRLFEGLNKVSIGWKAMLMPNRVFVVPFHRLRRPVVSSFSR